MPTASAHPPRHHAKDGGRTYVVRNQGVRLRVLAGARGRCRGRDS